MQKQEEKEKKKEKQAKHSVFLLSANRPGTATSLVLYLLRLRIFGHFWKDGKNWTSPSFRPPVHVLFKPDQRSDANGATYLRRTERRTGTPTLERLM
jgi:hypothetical protein